MSILQNHTAPLVSVLIPIFNHARFIEKCLDSLLSTGWAHLELIAIDDGSSDESLSIARTWAQRHESSFVRIDLSTQQNQGITRTLNRLIERARGDFLVFLASDDLLLPDSIRARLLVLLNHPDALAIFADATAIDDDGRQIAKSVLRERFHADVAALSSDRRRALELILNWSVPGPVFMARRVAFDTVGKYDERFFIEDRDYYLRLLADQTLLYLDQPVAAYRMHGTSISGNKLRQIRIGQEIMRIEHKLLPAFTGSAKLALQLRIWSNTSAIYTSSIWCKPFTAVRCAMARLIATCMLLAVRADLIYWAPAK
ncbi:glycosyltransferase involved in cell wall biosynthesis [Ralstonia sp. GP73]|jgi:glycosyltransferase involved in cell wall biosynthesis|uniref:Glycosyltransferase 2-like domain-containing protein n=2 Tax=Ralstonia TaxID=48736 RepID=A0AAD2BWI0_9RALS|nr:MULTISPECIES: glycosyltransferase [Ralstonia]MBT2180677.1 glycosyltransferase [Ralstonia pickettii]MDH6641967.1 glycosyltransferase involved in cell wall biosynthesis [Ralstonia sp. GP73]OCS50256.1 hypothetical protein BEK68_03170 [Ralstonia pickettii]CAJ0714037.1 hypothetical protein LMG7143_02899 [Ralstonia sp. LMG 18095]CAJ0791985.1 hypothetical protein LMG18095_02253 [Ralstonia sp. LMG 18095]